MIASRTLRTSLAALLVFLGIALSPLSAWSQGPAFFPTVMKNFALGSWVTILSENFEGAFPGAWELLGQNGTLWGKRGCRPFTGLNSGWAVGGGPVGDALPCGTDYPVNADSWMIFGPFSLAEATEAALTFQLWLNVENTFDTDTVCRLASVNNLDFWGTCSFGTTAGWTPMTLDFKNVNTLGDLRGQPQVWIALVFHSNAGVTFPEGAYLDDILIRKCVGGACVVPAATADHRLAGSPLVEKSAHFRRPSQ